jgi:hypothetical protein
MPVSFFLRPKSSMEKEWYTLVQQSGIYFSKNGCVSGIKKWNFKSLFLAFLLGLHACQFLCETKEFYRKRLVHISSTELNLFCQKMTMYVKKPMKFNVKTVLSINVVHRLKKKMVKKKKSSYFYDTEGTWKDTDV